MSARRRRWKAGSVVEVPLGDGRHTYAWLRKDPLISVLDARSMEDLAPAGIVARPVLFSVWVMGRALALWPEVGTIELPGELERIPEFVKRDLISGKITVYFDGRERPATTAEAESLEVAAVWEPEHVADRARDHFRGVPNVWAQSLRNSVLTGDGRV